ncbi:hypothetical protein VZQ01_00385 [Myxococcus faecalis]
MARQALDGRRVEQVGVVVEDTRESARALLEQQADVELRGLQLRRKLRERDARERQRGAWRVLQGEGDLEERRAAQVTLGLQFLDELLERDVLVLVGGEGAQPHLSQQLTERALRVDARAQDERVDEEADEALGLRAVAVRDGRAHGDVVLARVA